MSYTHCDSGRSTTATGSSSPARATSTHDLSSAALVPKAAYTVGAETPAARAMSAMVVPAKPLGDEQLVRRSQDSAAALAGARPPA